TALLNAINYVGANAIIADINGDDYNLSYDDAKRRVTKKTKAVIIPHIFGTPARDMERFKDMGVPVIEDCAQSIGSKIGGQYVGTIGDVSIFSFYATKVMTTGEGGMVASNSSELVERICDLRDYDNKDDYMVRYNYKMTDIQATMGIEQLKKLPDFINRRRRIAERYNEGLKDLPVRLPMASSVSDSIWFRYVIYSERANGLTRYLHEKGIGALKPVFKPLHILLGNKGDCPISERIWNNTVSLPIYPLLSLADVGEVIKFTRLFYSS
ncbi:MAG: DegT/DnrJ/EryC1/StrS family aminotransferase, partial [Candidatus Brocadiaceae bacterium]|nr:DegT/DnrJ/EryC1/StrS family aminotransferase [Candidatus Brocadiaceae bacterium]